MALRRLLAGRTAFVIAHRLSTVRGADRIVVLENGRIGEIGSHAELMARGGYYAALVETQRKGFLGRAYSSSKAVNGGTLVIQKPARPPCWSTST
jgi:ABC-type transport system involved in cytochrome bd biosynthesis fused ATPase/permease subunit